MNAETPNRLFVYGTLRRDSEHEMFHLLAKHARYLGEASVQGRLFDLGTYPGMISTDDLHRVIGELYEIDPSEWQTMIDQLDEYEGCSAKDPAPHEYRREVVRTRLSSGESFPAWAYLLNRIPLTAREIKSGDFLAWRAGA